MLYTFWILILGAKILQSPVNTNMNQCFEIIFNYSEMCENIIECKLDQFEL